MSEDRGFEVVDKRRTGTGEPSPAQESAEEPELDLGADEYEDVDSTPGMPDITVTGVLWTSIQLLSLRAWSGMGLNPNPATGKIEKDLNEARRAIDVMGDLAKHLMADANDQEKRELQNMLTDLRVNFVRQSGQG